MITEGMHFLKSISEGKWVILDGFGEEEEGSEETDDEEDAYLAFSLLVFCHVFWGNNARTFSALVVRF